MDTKWSEDEEKILKIISDKSFIMSELHKKRYLELTNKLKYFKIPIIILSGINSVIAVGMSEYVSQSAISTTNCLLSLICGIIGSIELFLKITENSNIEYKCARDFYLLHIEIKKTLALDRINRDIDGKAYLDDRFNDYMKMISDAQLISGPDAIHNFTEEKLSETVERCLNNKIGGFPFIKKAVFNTHNSSKKSKKDKSLIQDQLNNFKNDVQKYFNSEDNSVKLIDNNINKDSKETLKIIIDNNKN